MGVTVRKNQVGECEAYCNLQRRDRVLTRLACEPRNKRNMESAKAQQAEMQKEIENRPAVRLASAAACMP